MRRDCEDGHHGFWNGDGAKASNLNDCIARCESCRRCGYVSFSAQNGDCSWYAACDMEDLRRPPKNAPDYTTVHVKEPGEVTNRVFPDTNRVPRLAIATMASGGHKCALVQWCERMRLFVDAFQAHVGWRVDVLVISPAGDVERADCPWARVVGFDSRVASAMRACSAKATVDPKQHASRAGESPIMQKLLLLSLVRYDFVVFADADVDFVPEEQASPRQAAEHLMGLLTPPAHARRHSRDRSQLSSSVAAPGSYPGTRDAPWWEFAANADASSPINAGIFIVRPSMALFKDALAVLADCRFNRTHGWDHVGRLRTLEFNMTHPDGEKARVDRHATLVDVPTNADAFTLNKWSFAGGDIEQGLFWYLFYIRRRTGAYLRYSDPLKVLHWWYVPRPWLVGSPPDDAQGIRAVRSSENESIPHLSRAYNYLSRSAMPGGSSPSSSPCMRALWTMRRAIEDDPRFDVIQDFKNGIGITVPFQPLRARIRMSRV